MESEKLNNRMYSYGDFKMPTDAHLHLLLGHLPVVGLPAFLLVLNWAARRRSLDGLRIGLVGILFFSLATIAVYFTGEGAEHQIEHFPGISEEIIEEHEEIAIWAMIFAALSGLSAGGALFTLGTPKGKLFLAGTGLFGALTTGVVLLTASAGGVVRHGDEISGAKAELQDGLKQGKIEDREINHGEVKSESPTPSPEEKKE